MSAAPAARCPGLRIPPPSPAPFSSMRPDTPPEHVDHLAEAPRLERTAERYPEDAEHLLVQAAAHLELSGDRPRATTLYDSLLSSSVPLDNPQLVRALKASNLW